MIFPSNLLTFLVLFVALSAEDRAGLVNALKVSCSYASNYGIVVLLCLCGQMIKKVGFRFVLFIFLFLFWGVFQDKLKKFAGQHSDVLETLSQNVRKRVEVLREMQVCLLLQLN